ncbi:MAG: hypothetical protein LQ339_008416 [Xanthoria mediterranea]|nr:MAG: hypothetical protein LQ339_008416 [Xanthoria mediterranea]
MASTAHGLSQSQFDILQEKAGNAKATAYCPYSKFRVGAAFLSEDGTVITGGNIENASYPVGTCAERVALGKAVSEGHRHFMALAVATDISPPGSGTMLTETVLESISLRIREFCTLDMPVIMFDKDGQYVVKLLEELLPMSFGPEDLKGARTV